MSKGKNGITYAEAGVDIDAGNALVERIKPAAKRTARPAPPVDPLCITRLSFRNRCAESQIRACPYASPLALLARVCALPASTRSLASRWLHRDQSCVLVSGLSCILRVYCVYTT